MSRFSANDAQHGADLAEHQDNRLQAGRIVERANESAQMLDGFGA